MTEINYFTVPFEPIKGEKELFEALFGKKRGRYPELKYRSSCYGRLMAIRLACKLFDIDRKDIQIDTGEQGKPYFKSHPQIHFNISHCKNRVVAVVSDEAVGIDIEKIRGYNKRIAERYFTEKEKAYVNTDRRFFEIWTKKEAYIKQKGKGFSIPLSSFEVTERDFTVFERDGFIISVYSTDYLCQMKFTELSSEDMKQYIG